jgi:hypothetical protein
MNGLLNKEIGHWATIAWWWVRTPSEADVIAD